MEALYLSFMSTDDFNVCFLLFFCSLSVSLYFCVCERVCVQCSLPHTFGLVMEQVDMKTRGLFGDNKRKRVRLYVFNDMLLWTNQRWKVE